MKTFRLAGCLAPGIFCLISRGSQGVTGTKFFPAGCCRMPDQFQDGGETRNLNMALASTSNGEKKDIFKDVRFFLAEENNEEV